MNRESKCHGSGANIPKVPVKFVLVCHLQNTLQRKSF